MKKLILYNKIKQVKFRKIIVALKIMTMVLLIRKAMKYAKIGLWTAEDFSP